MNNYSKIRDLYIPSKMTEVRMEGMFDDAIRRVIDSLFLKLDTDALVSWFKERSDPFAAGEFFGKILRAAANLCAYTGDSRLKEMIDGMVRKILKTRDPDGCISTVKREAQPNGTNGSDLWERKYVLLGLYEYFENFGPSLDKENDVLEAMISLAEYTAFQIGEGPGKTKITDTGWAFCGIESSSILEPVMKLYLVCGNKNLFEFGKYIVDSGACSRENIFKAALSGKSPYKIGSNGNPKESIAKAYEMMSCFEGLLEYYRATGKASALEATKHFIGRILEEEITYLGSGGADAPYNLGPGKGEQWNRTYYEQTNPDIELAMETCVTVTCIKLLFKAYLITGDVSYVDKIELSLYNALIGALSPDGGYFEYFPKFNGTRGYFDNFSYLVGSMKLSCCTANGPMGLAVIPKLSVTRAPAKRNTYCLNLFIQETYKDECGTEFKVETQYPYNGDVSVKILKTPADGISLAFRIPSFAKSYTASETVKEDKGYAIIEKIFSPGDILRFSLNYGPEAHYSPVSVNPLAKKSVLYTYGPTVLALDRSFDPKHFDKTCGKPIENYRVNKGFKDMIKDPFTVTVNGSKLIPYYAAGRSFDELTEFKTWFKTDKV
ncbi:MAG: glycoside hydrolase family 127 protein [Clostridia bacterium]|nr:glycoside hydrolase family 127 protein [Clostridia bacterium]